MAPSSPSRRSPRRRLCARLARLPTLIGHPNSAPAVPSHAITWAGSSATMHARGIHARIEQFLASCQRIAISHSGLIRPHVIRRACHLLSHRQRLHMLDILHTSTRLYSMVCCARLRAPQLLFLIRHLCLFCRMDSWASLPTLILFNHLFFFFFSFY